MGSDYDVLISMGFSEAKVARAMKATKNAGLQPAMDWLFAHAEDADDAMDVDNAGSSTGEEGKTEDDGEITAEQATAQSLKCDDCGRLLRDATAAELHAVKTQHVNFSESTSVIKPLTEEEKNKKLEELKVRMAAKREEKKRLEIEEEKMREKVRRKTGQEIVAVKEKIQEAEMKKALDAKLREKDEEKAARAKIKAQIEQDKRDRAAKLEKDKLIRQGLSTESLYDTPKPSTPSSAGGGVATKDYQEARIQFRLPAGGTVIHTFQATDTLSTVYDFAATHAGTQTFKLLQSFPRKVLEEKTKSLKELGLVPSAALVIQ
ncbi:ubiquitin-related domain-containing protein [Chytridium lagenaria]|nr:ubiquitin-related domain-containing protein [Chytridium lagenaria]